MSSSYEFVSQIETYLYTLYIPNFTDNVVVVVDMLTCTCRL